MIRPFYLKKRDAALEAVAEFFPRDVPYALHRSEGAMFLWIWIENSPRPSREIYESLKQRGVVVVPGEYFFFGAPEDGWKHRHECFRISFAMPDDEVREGLRIIAEEIAGLKK